MRKFSYVVRLFAVIGKLFVIVFEFVVRAVKSESRAARKHYRVYLLCGFFAFQKVGSSCARRALSDVDSRNATFLAYNRSYSCMLVLRVSYPESFRYGYFHITPPCMLFKGGTP